jgi:UDP-3-O-[3-hydroxymyristoyl] glucosamine N-acyltransferase
MSEQASFPARPPAAATSLGMLASLLDATLEGDPDLPITGAAGLEDACPGDLVRVEDARWLAAAEVSPAAALLVPLDLPGVSRPALRVADPRRAFISALACLYPPAPVSPGVHPSAVIGEGVSMGEGCAVMAYAVVGARARLGRGVVIHPHVVLGEDVEVGDESVLFPNVTLYPRVSVGRRARLHAGVVIGADGFGYVSGPRGHEKVPHVGTVIIEDDVEVGANVTIDRGTTGATRIGAGTKIDNLVQIGHNCQVGQHGLLVAMVGLGGSTTLDDGVVVGGHAGLNDHIHLVSGVIVGGHSAVWGDVKTPGIVSGDPARPHRQQLRVQAALQRLPELARTVADLARRIARLEQGEGTNHENTKSTKRE